MKSTDKKQTTRKQQMDIKHECSKVLKKGNNSYCGKRVAGPVAINRWSEREGPTRNVQGVMTGANVITDHGHRANARQGRHRKWASSIQYKVHISLSPGFTLQCCRWRCVGSTQMTFLFTQLKTTMPRSRRKTSFKTVAFSTHVNIFFGRSRKKSTCNVPNAMLAYHATFITL